jgi:hypothetical protein
MVWNRERRWLVALLLLGGVVTLGCNPLTMPFFMMYGIDSKLPAKFPLAAQKVKGDEVKVVILTTFESEVPIEFIGTERQLASDFCRALQAGCKENRERVSVVEYNVVEKYKVDHPNWQNQGPAKIGEHLGADFVIQVAVSNLRLYEPGSTRTLFRGRADMDVQVIDVHRPDELPVFDRGITAEYPTDPKPAGDSNPASFRRQFLEHLATELTWLFTPHLTSKSFARD